MHGIEKRMSTDISCPTTNLRHRIDGARCVRRTADCDQFRAIIQKLFELFQLQRAIVRIDVDIVHGYARIASSQNPRRKICVMF